MSEKDDNSMSIVKDLSLAESGRRKIEWVRSFMPALSGIEKRFEAEQPFRGLKIAVSVHLEAKTANLAFVLQKGGAQVFLTGSNPLSTQDDVAAGAASLGIETFGIHGVDAEGYTDLLKETLKCSPHIIIDDGGDLVNLLAGECSEYAGNLLGGCEETTTGILRLKAREAENALPCPMVAVNDAKCKHYYDNKYGTGQSVWDGIMHTTNLVVAGKTVVVAGYGWCGRGIAMRAKGFGAKVIVTEVDPVKALEAMMDGFQVMPMAEAARRGDLFVTATGCADVITGEHMLLMKDGAVLCNAGHFNVEVDYAWLEANHKERFLARDNIMGYTLASGSTVFLLAEGRLVNLASGDGHPVEIMDMSFAIQALSARYIAEHHGELSAGVTPVPEDIDKQVSLRKLSSVGMHIDTLTPRQEAYLASWTV